ncbi:hypothetical protein IWW50_004239 [Coemansia erecta]|nr:hypothetical protein GGF43_004153 [Coemansia sp. RSA 2618]KAJ2822377.1 hypothetical protein IWW50_004239 [Coemansia erecta]
MSVPAVAQGIQDPTDLALAPTQPSVSLDTTALGMPWEADRPLWVFGYGSIIYRVDFPIEDQVFGFIHHRKRAFLQKSHDHRGTPHAPGRVCTLIPHAEWNSMFPDEPADPQSVCWGMAYKVKRGMEREVKKHLDYREKDGYTVDFVDVYGELGAEPVVAQVLVYVGVSSNPSFAGPSSIDDTARVIARAEGPSGTNREYLFKLCDSLRTHHPEALDPYLAKLEALVRSYL